MGAVRQAWRYFFLMALTAFLLCIFTPRVWAQATERGFIESPSAFVSGIGFISGWKCNAENITLKIWCNNLALPHKPVSMDVPRPDTQVVCDGPDTNNGWIAQVNWNDYQNCTRVEAFDNGHMFASRDFTVGTIGDEFIRDQEGTTIKVADFPVMGQVSRFVWSTATQHWEAMHSFPCREEDNCDDPTTNNGNNTGAPPYPEMIVVDNAYAGDQDMVQYKGMLALPSPVREQLVFGAMNGTRAGAPSFCCTHIAHSIIYESDAWMVTRHTSGAEVRIPKEDLPERLGEVDLLYTKTPLMMDLSGVIIVNMSGVGGPAYVFDTERIERGSETLGVAIFVNRPELAHEGGQHIKYFINKDTAEIGFKIVPANLNKAGGGWLDAMFPNAKCDGRDWGEENRIQCREKIKAIDAWWLEVLFPNQGRGPWRQVGSWWVTIEPGRSWLSSDMQSYLNSSNDRLFSLASSPDVPYATDLTGTGKLEIIYLSETQYGAWRHKDNLSQFLSPELELGSAVD